MSRGHKHWIGAMTDDGADAQGFHCLLAALASVPGWQVEGAAPARPWASHGTATGASVSDPPAPACRNVKQVTVQVADLPPALIARLICSRAPESCTSTSRMCIVAGVNHGPNVGPSLIHSGTFCGALIAAWLGFAAVAVSLDDVYSVDEANPGPLCFPEAAGIARFAVGWTLTRSPVLCNVNVPNSIRARRPLVFEAATPHRDPCSDQSDLRHDTEVLRDGRVAITVFPGGCMRASASLSRTAAAAIADDWSRPVVGDATR